MRACVGAWAVLLALACSEGGGAGVYTASDAASEAGPDAASDPAGTDTAAVASDAIPLDSVPDAPPDVPPAGPVLQCVTARLPETNWPRALRFWITPDDTAYSLRILESDHHVYASGPYAAPVESAATATGTSGAGSWDLSWTDGRLRVAQDPQAGPVLAGTVTRTGFDDLPIWCWPPGALLPHDYDPATGTCRDGAVPAVRLRLPVAFIAETGLGRCADLGGVALEAGDLYYPQLSGWDLRGADLHDASLHFADLADARLEGADLGQIDYGYARITGTVDAYTVLPDPQFGACTVEDGRIECMR